MDRLPYKSYLAMKVSDFDKKRNCRKKNEAHRTSFLCGAREI